METRVTRILEEHSIEFSLRPHSRKVYTTAEAADERGVEERQIVKCMVVETPDHQFLMALVPGDRKLSTRMLARVIGAKKVSLASREDVERVTGFPIGAISPVGLQDDLEIVMDPGIAYNETVAMSAGKADVGLVLDPNDLIALLSPRLESIAK